MVHLSHLFRVMQAEVNAAPAIDKTVFTLAFSALYLSYLLNEIFLSTGSHQGPVERGRHGIAPVMIEVSGPEVLGIVEKDDSTKIIRNDKFLKHEWQEPKHTNITWADQI